jgi:hypothetical protein
MVSSQQHLPCSLDQPVLPSRIQTSSGFGFPTASTPAKVDEMLEHLVPKLPCSTHLHSLSLYVGQSAYRSILRATFIALLNALPASCSSLEMDTCGRDHCEEDKDAHVCDVVRRLLPRMQHVCIQTGAMCSAMVMGSAVHRSHLKSLIVDCKIVRDQQIQRCGPGDYTGNTEYPAGREDLAWFSVTAVVCYRLC